MTSDTTPDWLDGIDVCEHHCIDFDAVHRQGVRVVIARAGRGTRQDSRWIEHTRAACYSGLTVGSYWHVYPSRLPAHQQAELWSSAIRSAPWRLTAGHWADFSTTDGLDPFEMGRYAAGFLRRMDELLGRTVGVFTCDTFWRHNVRFDVAGRPRWLCTLDEHSPIGTDVADDVWAVRTRAADRGGPGQHRVHASPDMVTQCRPAHQLHLVPRRPDESLAHWQSRWMRTPEVATLQEHLNRLGADLFVDGVYGPATDAAMRTCRLLRRRDGFTTPSEWDEASPLPAVGQGH